MNPEAAKLSAELAQVESGILRPIRDRIVEELHGALTPTGQKLDALRGESDECNVNTKFIHSALDELPVSSVAHNLIVDSTELLPAIQSNIIWQYKYYGHEPYKKRILNFHPCIILGSKPGRDDHKSRDIILSDFGVSSERLSVVSMSSKRWEALCEVRGLSGLAALSTTTRRITENDIEDMYYHGDGKLWVTADLPGAIRDQHYAGFQPYAKTFGRTTNGINNFGLYLKYNQAKTAELANGLTDMHVEQYGILETLSRLAIDFGVSDEYVRLHKKFM